MTNTAEAKKEEKRLLEFNVTETEPFHETYQAELTTATQLTYLFDKFFGEVFNDYYKCQLIPISNATTLSVGFELNLAFRSQVDATEEFDKDGKVAAFVPISESETSTVKNTMFRNIKSINNKARLTTQFMISQPACELLRTFFVDQFIRDAREFINNPEPKKYCSYGLIGERTVQENVGYMKQVNIIENVVMHIDINKILQMIKGDRSETGDHYLYSIRPRTDIFANVPQSGGMVPIKSETVVEIIRLNEEKMDAFNATIGSYQNNQDVVSPIRQIRYTGR